jgi:N-formylglutamate deformylase
MNLDKNRNQIILHIPHSSTEIPFYDGYNIDLIDFQTNLLVDHATDKIFRISDVEALIFPYNRIFCDVERLDDEHEVLFEKGRGFFYTKTDDNQDLRMVIPEIKTKVKSMFYDTHHRKLEEMVDERLKNYSSAIIIDCHSFTNEPFDSDIDKSPYRPDICLGTDKFHTPKWLIDHFEKYFVNNGFSVKIDSPYSGTIVPLKHYNKDNRVLSIMIEINRKLYMDNFEVIDNQVVNLQKLIFNSLEIISE